MRYARRCSSAALACARQSRYGRPICTPLAYCRDEKLIQKHSTIRKTFWTNQDVAIRGSFVTADDPVRARQPTTISGSVSTRKTITNAERHMNTSRKRSKKADYEIILIQDLEQLPWDPIVPRSASLTRGRFRAIFPVPQRANARSAWTYLLPTHRIS